MDVNKARELQKEALLNLKLDTLFQVIEKHAKQGRGSVSMQGLMSIHATALKLYGFTVRREGMETIISWDDDLNEN